MAWESRLVEPVGGAVCPPDSVASGTVCIDKYEASVWYVPPEQKALIGKIQRGMVSLADLTAAGAVQLGLAFNPATLDIDLANFGCPFTGKGCTNIYAVSIPGVTPARFINWFQAAAVARNSLKRLPTNQEWQVAALGTPDGAPCNVGPDGFVASTGSQPGCVSDVGAFDMVGNVFEWVAEWMDFVSAPCSTWLAGDFASDIACVGGGQPVGPAHIPGGMIRGGFFGATGLGGGTGAGPFAIRANIQVLFVSPGGGLGFRCAR